MTDDEPHRGIPLQGHEPVCVFCGHGRDLHGGNREDTTRGKGSCRACDARDDPRFRCWGFRNPFNPT